jgi:hypothetical protein
VPLIYWYEVGITAYLARPLPISLFFALALLLCIALVTFGRFTLIAVAPIYVDRLLGHRALCMATNRHPLGSLAVERR